MPYLATIKTIAHVDIRMILGTAESSIEVYSLLYNFFKICGLTGFEEGIMNYKICIFQITDDESKYFDKLWNKYEEELEDTRDRDIEDNVFGNFKFVYYINSEGEVMFTKKEVKTIKQIIKNANKVL